MANASICPGAWRSLALFGRDPEDALRHKKLPVAHCFMYDII